MSDDFYYRQKPNQTVTPLKSVPDWVEPGAIVRFYWESGQGSTWNKQVDVHGEICGTGELRTDLHHTGLVVRRLKQDFDVLIGEQIHRIYMARKLVVELVAKPGRDREGDEEAESSG